MAKKQTKDGRWIYSGKDYFENKKAKWEEQGRCCAICGLYVALAQAEADHIKSRGMSGSKRDDSLHNLRVVHGFCHFRHHFETRDQAAKVKRPEVCPKCGSEYPAVIVGKAYWVCVGCGSHAAVKDEAKKK